MKQMKSKAKCVFTIKRKGKPYRYMTRVIIRGQRFYLGCFKTEGEATRVYQDFMEYLDKNPIGTFL
jgi:hypothetical protein